jgi:hypothetical protein
MSRTLPLIDSLTDTCFPGDCAETLSCLGKMQAPQVYSAKSKRSARQLLPALGSATRLSVLGSRGRRVAALEANWRGSDNPRIQGTEARLQALFTEEAMRVTRTFRQVRNQRSHH